MIKKFIKEQKEKEKKEKAKKTEDERAERLSPTKRAQQLQQNIDQQKFLLFKTVFNQGVRQGVSRFVKMFGRGKGIGHV